MHPLGRARSRHVGSAERPELFLAERRHRRVVPFELHEANPMLAERAGRAFENQAFIPSTSTFTPEAVRCPRTSSSVVVRTPPLSDHLADCRFGSALRAPLFHCGSEAPPPRRAPRARFR